MHTVLTPENFRQFAESHLTRKRIFKEDVDSCLKLPSSINRNITRCCNGGNTLRVVINDVVTFLNAFDRNAASELLLYLVGRSNECRVKSILFILGFPMTEYDDDFLEKLKAEIYNETP